MIILQIKTNRKLNRYNTNKAYNKYMKVLNNNQTIQITYIRILASTKIYIHKKST